MSATCRCCGKAIEWAGTLAGKKIPLDPAAPIYIRVEAAKAWLLSPVESRRANGPMVSHFATCAKAGDFGTGGRGTVDAVNYCAREELSVSFAIGHVEVMRTSTDFAVGETLEDAVAALIVARSKRTGG